MQRSHVFSTNGTTNFPWPYYNVSYAIIITDIGNATGSISSNLNNHSTVTIDGTLYRPNTVIAGLEDSWEIDGLSFGDIIRVVRKSNSTVRIYPQGGVR